MFFPVQQWPRHNHIVTDKGSNLLDECAVECVHLCPQEEECTPPSEGTVNVPIWHYIEFTGRMLIKVNKNNAAVKARILLELGIYKVFQDI